MHKQKNNRGKFSRSAFVKTALATGFLAVLSKVGFSNTDTKQSENTGEKVKMLTPDGKLVEVDKRVLEAASNKKKATESDIHNFISYPNNKKG